MLVDNWWLFLVFVGCILFLVVSCFVFEACRKPKYTLELQPWKICLQIVALQISFYGWLFLAVFTIDLLAAEIFWVSQVFNAYEYCFVGTRCWINNGALLSALVCNIVAVIFLIQKTDRMLDFSFTTVVIHFIVVSIYMREFPASGTWWLFLGVGFLVEVFFAEIIGYHLETMERKARLVDPVKEARRQAAEAARKQKALQAGQRKKVRGKKARRSQRAPALESLAMNVELSELPSPSIGAAANTITTSGTFAQPRQRSASIAPSDVHLNMDVPDVSSDDDYSDGSDLDDIAEVASPDMGHGVESSMFASATPAPSSVLARSTSIAASAPAATTTATSVTSGSVTPPKRRSQSISRTTSSSPASQQRAHHTRRESVSTTDSILAAAAAPVPTNAVVTADALRIRAIASMLLREH
eukprot:TRINITY_DN11400_c0_g1_i1.p1 TRINITY_DN11400_c0_g1~~TRINITY_DN11400_c0_g1_i1.p1  ORF type:complete len:414 (+),score=80.30 TRINITY_DN11400_c0_g1_i1:60-1301(+)